MAIGYDPFSELDELRQQLLSGGTTSRSFPMDAYRRGDEFVVHLDLPGAQADTIDATVEGNVLTVSAERRFEQREGDEILVRERSQGRFSRQVTLGTMIDTENIRASYEGGVLTLALPVAPTAKPRKIEITGGD